MWLTPGTLTTTPTAAAAPLRLRIVHDPITGYSHPDNEIEKDASNTCRSQAVSCCASADSFALESSAQVCPSATPAASARLCHRRRGRVGMDDDDGDDGGGLAPRLPAGEEPVPLPTIGQKAYTVFFGFRARKAWRSSSVCGVVFAARLVVAAAGCVYRRRQTESEAVVDKCKRGRMPEAVVEWGSVFFPVTQTKRSNVSRRGKPCDKPRLYPRSPCPAAYKNGRLQACACTSYPRQ